MSLTEKLDVLDRLHADGEAAPIRWAQNAAGIWNAYPEFAAELRRLAEENAELQKELAAVREVEEAQDRGLAAIYTTVEKAIGRGCWHSQMEAVEDLAKRYAEAREDSARLSEVYRRADVDPRGYIAFRPIQLPVKADWDGVTCKWNRDVFNAAIDAVREGE